MKALLYLVLILVSGAIPFAIYWMGGGNFERGYVLGCTTCFSLTFMTGVFVFVQVIDSAKDKANV